MAQGRKEGRSVMAAKLSQTKRQTIAREAAQVRWVELNLE